MGELVGTKVEGANRRRAAVERDDQLPIDLNLLFLGRQRPPGQEEHFRAVEADAARAAAQHARGLAQEIDVGLDAGNARPIGVTADWHLAVACVLADETGRRAPERKARRHEGSRSICPSVSVDAEKLPCRDLVDQAGNLTDHRDSQAAGNDHGVAMRTAVFHDHADEMIEIDGEQIEDRGLVGDQNDSLLGRFAAAMILRTQVPENPAKHVLDIEDPLLKERARQFLERGHILVEGPRQSPFGRGPRRQAAGQVSLHGAVLEDHELRLQDRAVVFAHQLRDPAAEACDLLAGGFDCPEQSLAVRWPDQPRSIRKRDRSGVLGPIR